MSTRSIINDKGRPKLGGLFSWRCWWLVQRLVIAEPLERGDNRKLEALPANETHFRFLHLNYGPPSPREFGPAGLTLNQA